jgi:hypothetical protein
MLERRMLSSGCVNVLGGAPGEMASKAKSHKAASLLCSVGAPRGKYVSKDHA